MEAGVYGEHGVHVPRRVVMARGYDLDHVTIQHLQMVVCIAQKTSMTRHNVLIEHAQVCMSLLSAFILLH
jgi:hypothetical protein